MAIWLGKRVLVTGGAGFIGSHLVDKLMTLGATVTVADNLSKAGHGYLYDVWNAHGLKPEDGDEPTVVQAGKHRLVVCNLQDLSAARSVVQNQEVVFHLAATIGGRGYIDTHPADCCGNFAVDYNVISEAARAGVEHLSYASSACVYPVSLQKDYDSTHLLREDEAFRDEVGNADREYGWAKLMGEMQLLAFHRQYGLRGSIVRYVTAYGEREDDTHAIVALIRRAVERQDPYLVWGTGEEDRDFTHVSDIVEGTILAAERISDATPVNLGTSKRYKIKEVVAMIHEIAGFKPKEVFFDTSKPVGVVTRALDIERTSDLLGWTPKVDLREGLTRTIRWFADARPEPVETIA
jgi:nucleoside-diphosphate-sugar epimerase